MNLAQIIEWLAVAEGPQLIQLLRELTDMLEKRTNVGALPAVLVAVDVAVDAAEELKFPKQVPGG